MLKFFRYESLITDIGEKHVHRCGSGQGMLRSLAGADMKKVPRRGSVSSIFDSEATFLLSQALRPRARARPRKHEKLNCNTGVLLYLIAGNVKLLVLNTPLILITKGNRKFYKILKSTGMKSDKIKIAKFLENKINNPEKITGGEMIFDPNMVSSILGPSIIEEFQAPESFTNNSCPINCTCSSTQSNGCIQGGGIQTGEGK